MTENRPDEPRRPETESGIPSRRSRGAWFLGIALLAVSVALLVAVPVVLFLPLSAGWKAGIILALLVAEEVVFWLAALVLGQEVVRRYRRFLDPRYWLAKR